MTLRLALPRRWSARSCREPVVLVWGDDDEPVPHIFLAPITQCGRQRHLSDGRTLWIQAHERGTATDPVPPRLCRVKELMSDARLQTDPTWPSARHRTPQRG